MTSPALSTPAWAGIHELVVIGLLQILVAGNHLDSWTFGFRAFAENQRELANIGRLILDMPWPNAVSRDSPLDA